jgi:hypothetical protein
LALSQSQERDLADGDFWAGLGEDGRKTGESKSFSADDADSARP